METIVTQHTARIACVKEKNNLIVSGAYDGTVQLWDVREGHYRGIHTFKSTTWST